MTAMEPYERMGQYGSGVTGLIAGYPGQYTTSTMPNPTPLQTALGTASVLGGIYGNIRTPGTNVSSQASNPYGITAGFKLLQPGGMGFGTSLGYGTS